MKTLSFDKEQHTYTVDGEVIPSVTMIVKVVTGKDLSAIPEHILTAARERGEAIHRDVESGAFATDEGRWIKEQLPQGELEHEKAAYAAIDGQLVAGTADILSLGGIDDIKSQATEDILGWAIQLNLYRRIFGRNQLRVLHVPKSGNYRVIQIPVFSDAQVMEVMEAYRAGRVLDASFLAGEKAEAPSLDLIVYKSTTGELTTNARAILATVKAQLANYRPENYSEANIADAKRDKAELNAAAKKLNDRRLELEREFMKPFNEFKDVVTETFTLIKAASSQIDSVVKAVEEREKAEKEKRLIEAWDGLGFTIVSISKVWNPAWLNKTAKVKDIIAEMGRIIEKVTQDLVVLDRIGEPDAKAYYLDTLNLDAALREADRIKANRERLAAIERAKAEAPAVMAPEMPAGKAQATPTASEPAKATADTPEVAPALLERSMRVWGTYEQLVELSEFLNKHNIEFEKI